MFRMVSGDSSLRRLELVASLVMWHSARIYSKDYRIWVLIRVLRLGATEEAFTKTISCCKS